jgi:hypothetical protein
MDLDSKLRESSKRLDAVTADLENAIYSLQLKER